MKIAVIGLWHLGSVTTACLCKAGYQVVGYDPDQTIIANLKKGCAPIYEPNLESLLIEAQANGNVIYSNHVDDISDCDVVWITFDTPVDCDDQADVNFVTSHISLLEEHIKDQALVLVSSQIPVGTTQKLQMCFSQEKQFIFAYIPENLRLGKAIDIFMKPARIVVGLDCKQHENKIRNFLKPFSENIVFMSIASAEMTKHAINGFLALSVTFINELATLCEAVGANAYEVEQGLKSEERIGSKAYLHPGDAIAGGTLLRDIHFLNKLGKQTKKHTHLISSVIESNKSHQKWVREKLMNIYQDLDGKKIAVLGLTYKSDTNTLRRSSAIETCQWLHEQGCVISAFDPHISEMTDECLKFIHIKNSYQDAILNADAVLITTSSPQFCHIKEDELISASNKTIHLIDPNGCLAKTMKNNLYINYYSVGNLQCNTLNGLQSSQAPVKDWV